MGDADRNLEEQIRGVEEQIQGVEKQIRVVEQKIERLEEHIETCFDIQERARLRDEKAQLREQIQQGRGEGSPVKRGRVETPQHWQAFVQSAAKHYKEWEDSADVEKDSAMKFLTVSGDPLLNFPKGYLLGIRECYRDFKKILEDSEVGRCFVVLGTSGIEKSCFSVFWVCHLAANKKKVVWKLHKKFNLLDFSDEVAKFDGQLDESDPTHACILVFKSTK